MFFLAFLYFVFRPRRSYGRRRAVVRQVTRSDLVAARITAISFTICLVVLMLAR